MRYPGEVRWTEKIRERFDGVYEIIEEGQNGRLLPTLPEEEFDPLSPSRLIRPSGKKTQKKEEHKNEKSSRFSERSRYVLSCNG